jgi:4-amino-4-deoxy-L-arabinose transferase-like glycosyltransferase
VIFEQSFSLLVPLVLSTQPCDEFERISLGYEEPETNSPQQKKGKAKKKKKYIYIYIYEFGGSTWGGDPRRARRAAAAARRGAGAVRNRVRRCPRPGAHRSAGIGDAAGCAPRGWRIDCSAARGGARMPGPNRRASRCAGGQPGRDSGVGAVFFLLSILFFVCIFFCLFVCFQWFHRQGRSSPLDTVLFGFFFFFFFFFGISENASAV